MSYPYSTPSQPANNIIVKRLIIQETGTYNPMFQRPYLVDVQDHNLDAIAKCTSNMNYGMEPTALASMASRIIKPTAVVDQNRDAILIPDGWTRRRLRFVAEVEHKTATGSINIFWFQGFTDHLGVDHAGNLDMGMRFYINSMMRITRMLQTTATGSVWKDVVIESGQILNAQNISQGQQRIWRMRPCDVYSGIQENHLGKISASVLTDTRTANYGENVNFVNSRKNNVPANYLSSFIGAYQSATELAHIGQGNDNILNRAQANAYNNEAEPEVNPFLRAIAGIRGNQQVTDFTLAELIKLDPEVQYSRKPKYNRVSPSNYGSMHSAGQTENWTGSDRTTVVAAALANAVPSIMLENFIGCMHFTATNRIIGARSEILPVGEILSLAGTDMRAEIHRVFKRIESEVLWDLSFGNQDQYTLDMKVDTFGETFLRIQVGNDPRTDFVVPSFGDGLISQVYTSQQKVFDAVTSDMERLTNTVREVMVGVDTATRGYTPRTSSVY